jgi:MFS family permease
MKPILADLHLERAAFATAATVRMLAMVVAMSVAGQLTDRFGARLVLGGGALIVGLGNLATARVGSLWELYPVMAFIGPGQAAIGSVAASALVLRQFRRRRGLAIGVLNGGDNLINSSVPLITAYLLAGWGWRAAMATLGSAYLVLAVLILWLLRSGEGISESDKLSSRSHQRGSWKTVPWRSLALWMLIVAYAGIYAFITSVQLHFHAFQTDSGLTPAQASQVLSTQILVGAIGSPLFGWMCERLTARRTLLFVAFGLTAGSVMLWTFHGMTAFTVWALFHGTVNSGVVAILALVLAELFGDRQIGRLMGLAMMFCMGSTMLGNLYSAAMFDHFGSYLPVWRSYTALMVFTLVPVLWLARQSKR